MTFPVTSNIAFGISGCSYCLLSIFYISFNFSSNIKTTGFTQLICVCVCACVCVCLFVCVCVCVCVCVWSLLDFNAIKYLSSNKNCKVLPTLVLRISN